MGRASPAIAGFVAGEWAPQMEARIDTEKYPLSAHIAQNFIALKQGAATFRPGTAFVQPVKNSANRTWLLPFQFSQTAGNSFLLEFGDRYVRFYANHGPLLATGISAWSGATSYVIGNLVLVGGIVYYCILANLNQTPPNATYWYPMAQYQGSSTTAIYEIPSPYAVADLTDSLGEFALQFAQSGDVLYLAGGAAGAGYAPQTLTRFANSPPNWQFATYSPTDGPYADAVPLVPGSEIALSVSATQGTAITITADGGPVFASTDVGRLVRIGSQQFNVTPWATQTAITAGAQNSFNGNNYTALNSATTGGSPPVHTQGAVLDGPAGVRWLYTDSGYGVAQITGFTDSQHVTAKVLTTFPLNVVRASASITAITQANPAVVSAAQAFTAGEAVFIVGAGGMTQVNQRPFTNQTASGTTVTLAGVDSTSFTAYTSGGTIIGNTSVEWQLGAWSATTEWPRANAFYKDRLFWGGKLKVWGSVPGLYNSHAPDFFGQQTTDSAMNETISGGDASNVTWMSPAILLLIGTEGGEYGLDSANFSTSPLGPANVEILRQSKWRCRALRPELVGTTVLYVQRAGRKVFAMDYNFYLNRYDSSDQSKLAYHITIGGIVATAYMAEPWSILWAVRADGTLLSYTFNREDNVTAWTRHNLGGSGQVESIAVIGAPDGSRDELWMIVNRTVNGAVVRTVEYMTKHYEGPQGGYAGDAQSSAWYVDCGVQFVAAPTGTITNITAAGSQPPGPRVTNVTFTAANSLSAGQTVYVSGVVATGNLPINGPWVVQGTPTGSQFTASIAGLFSFQYVSGGTFSLSAPSTATTPITGIPSVLWNQTVAILADGGVQTPQVVSGTGTLTLVGTFNTVTLGFGYQGNLVPSRFEGGADAGTAQGKVKKSSRLVLRLIDSGGGLIGQLSNRIGGNYQDPLGLTFIPRNTAPTGQPRNGLVLDNIRYNETTVPLDSPPPLMSGDFPLSFPYAPSSDQDYRDFYVLVQQNDPLPMTVAGLFPSYKVEEPQ